MHPNIIIHWPAIIVTTIVSFAFGGLWYMTLFGNTWAKLMNCDVSKKPEPAAMRKSFALQVLGLFLMTYVMAHSGQVWRASVWGAGADQADHIYGFFNGFFTWLGFFVPMQFGKVSWEGRPWKLFVINAGHDFINLQIIGQILAHWH
ncbi:MAG: DUF1761 domain-containing protein [Deltaproteobacteria bacterium]|nr:DUF1761 domain-containing protein [Deltaproteobacteria bacterium]MBI3294093.1 DUF1761 domain-containing protein [Deltaproteobacteria bacterium]